jgi:hypothetical protein
MPRCQLYNKMMTTVMMGTSSRVIGAYDKPINELQRGWGICCTIVVAYLSIQCHPFTRRLNSICKAKKEGKHARVDSATAKNSTCQAWTYTAWKVIRTMEHTIWKMPQAMRTLALTLKILIFAFPAVMRSCRRRKKETYRWLGSLRLYSVHGAMQMHVL